MSELFPITIKWSDLFISNTLQNFMIELRSFNITEIELDHEFQQTTLTGFRKYDSEFNKCFELVPNQVRIEKDKSISFFMIKTFELINFQQILRFISDNCPYISDFIQDQNIETVSLSISKNITRSNSLIVADEKISDFTIMKIWLENNHEELYPIIFAALIKMFYQQNLNPFELKSSSNLSRIRQNITHVNKLISNRISLLKSYKIKRDFDTCIKLEYFEFLNNQILKTKYFGMYEQNMDIKFLSYINCVDLKEKAINAENRSDLLF